MYLSQRFDLIIRTSISDVFLTTIELLGQCGIDFYQGLFEGSEGRSGQIQGIIGTFLFMI